MRAPPYLCVVLVACAGAPIDRSQHVGGQEELVRVAEVPVFGSLCEVETTDGAVVKGELLAVDEERIHVHSGAETRVILRSNARSIELRDLYTSPAIGLGVWTGAGTVSTLSHGWLAIISVPLWLGLGITSTVISAFGNDAKVLPPDFDQATQFARYPQGMPGTLPSQRAAEPITKVKTSTEATVPPLFLPGEEPSNPSGPPGGPRAPNR